MTTKHNQETVQQSRSKLSSCSSATTAAQTVSMNGFRITSYPGTVAGTSSVIQHQTTAATSPGITSTITKPTTTTTTPTTISNANANKINNIATGGGSSYSSSSGNSYELSGASSAFTKHINPPQQKQYEYNITATNGGSLAVSQQRQMKLQQQREHDLHINEPMHHPPPPSLTTMPPTTAKTTTPIALKGNNPFLNSPSPTDNNISMSMLATQFGFLDDTNSTEYTEPQQYRINKLQQQQQQQQQQQFPRNIVVDTVTTTASSDVMFIRSNAKTTLSFADYNASTQQQRLLQLTQQQQKLRNAVNVTTNNSNNNNSNNNIDVLEKKVETSNAVDKETLYAAIFKQYRNSPSRSRLLNNSSTTTDATNITIGNCPPVPLHRNQQPSPLSLLQQPTQPIVPRRSHSSPRPLQTTTSTITSNTTASNGHTEQQIYNDVNANGQRPRSLDRFNCGSTNDGSKAVYQPPPIPLRRFVGNVTRNVNSPQPVDCTTSAGTPKFSGKKSTSIDNIRSGLTPLNVIGGCSGGGFVPLTCDNVISNKSTAGMRHSVTFHGRQSDGQLQVDGEQLGNKERPMSYAFGSVPDQTYLENQLRAYSEQLRTITESVRKYSEQAKLLSELKRQQHLAKQQLTSTTTSTTTTANANTTTTTSTTTSCGTAVNTTIAYAQATSNFSSSMISPEIVGKSLASLSNSNEAQTPSSQLRLFLDNIRSTMRTEYQQNIPEEILQPIDKLKVSTLTKQHVQQAQPQNQQSSQRATNDDLPTPQQNNSSTIKQHIPAVSAVPALPARNTELPTPSDQLRVFLDAIRANKIPENDEKPKMVNSKTLESFITKPTQMLVVTTCGMINTTTITTTNANITTTTTNTNNMDTLARRRPKSVSNNVTTTSTTAGAGAGGAGGGGGGGTIATNKQLSNREHSIITSESFHQISDNLRLMSEDLKALSPCKVVTSCSSGNLKLAVTNGNSLTTELRVITSTSPLNNYGNMSAGMTGGMCGNDMGLLGTTAVKSPFTNSNTSLTQSLCSVNTHSGSTTSTTTPSTAPLMTDFNEILDSFQQMAEKYKSKGSYEYLRKCSEALRQHSQQLKLQQQLKQQQSQQQQQQRDQQQQNNNGFMLSSDDSSSCSTTPGSIREAVQNLLMQPRNGFQILDDRMRLFIDIIDSQDRFSQVS